jgi:hypothetical protein
MGNKLESEIDKEVKNNCVIPLVNIVYIYIYYYFLTVITFVKMFFWQGNLAT